MRGKVLFYKGEANLDQLHCCSVETKLNKKQLINKVSAFSNSLMLRCCSVMLLFCCVRLFGSCSHFSQNHRRQNKWSKTFSDRAALALVRHVTALWEQRVKTKPQLLNNSGYSGTKNSIDCEYVIAENKANDVLKMKRWLLIKHRWCKCVAVMYKMLQSLR